MPSPAAVAALLGVALASAFVPLVNIEAYIGGYAVVAAGDAGAAVGWGTRAVVAVVAAVGQMLGKTVFYCAGRGAFRVRRRRRRRPVSGKTAQRLARWRDAVERRPWAGPPLLLLSAFAGIPPYAIVSALAGTVRVNVVVFEATGLLGRSARFFAVLTGIGVLGRLTG